MGEAQSFAVGSRSQSLLPTLDRELTNPNARLLQDDDATPQQRLLGGGKIGEQERNLRFADVDRFHAETG